MSRPNRLLEWKDVQRLGTDQPNELKESVEEDEYKKMSTRSNALGLSFCSASIMLANGA